MTNEDTRRRERRGERRPGSSPDGSGSGDNLDEVRARGRDLLASAGSAIDRAMSADSLRYNEEQRQQSGE